MNTEESKLLLSLRALENKKGSKFKLLIGFGDQKLILKSYEDCLKKLKKQGILFDYKILKELRSNFRPMAKPTAKEIEYDKDALFRYECHDPKKNLDEFKMSEEGSQKDAEYDVFVEIEKKNINFFKSQENDKITLYLTKHGLTRKVGGVDLKYPISGDRLKILRNLLSGLKDAAMLSINTSYDTLKTLSQAINAKGATGGINEFAKNKLHLMDKLIVHIKGRGYEINEKYIIIEKN